MRLHDIIEAIDESRRIAITYHVSPDGDALGSALALLQGLITYGKEAYVVSKDSVVDNLSFLPCSKEITGDNIKPDGATDCVIVLDCGNFERISADLSDFNKTIINLDHHLSNDRYGTVNFVDAKAAATAELVYELLNDLRIEITKDMGTCLYTSLVTDTGSFRYSNTTVRTHEIVKELFDIGIDHSKIHVNIFDNRPYSKLKLMAKVLEEMELICNEKIVFMKISKDMARSIGEEVEDASDIVSMGNQVKGVEGAILAKEVDNGVKLSLRAKNDLDVRKVAQIFGGGGHVKASGAFIKDKNLVEVKAIIEKLLEKELV